MSSGVGTRTGLTTPAWTAGGILHFVNGKLVGADTEDAEAAAAPLTSLVSN